MALWSLVQLIHKESITVLHFDVGAPPAAILGPMETNLESHNFLRCDWVAPVEPAWGVSPASLLGYATFWHLGAVVITQTIPTFMQFVVAFGGAGFGCQAGISFRENLV